MSEGAGAARSQRLLLSLLAIFLIWNLLSFINSEYIGESLRGMRKMVKYAMIFIVTMDVMRNTVLLKRVTTVMLGWGYVIVLNGIVQSIIGFDLIRGRHISQMDVLHRICSSFVTPNTFSVYLVVIILILCSLIISRRRAIAEYALLAVPLCLALYMLFRTYSRGAWLSFIAAFMTLAFIKNKRIIPVFICMVIVGGLLLPGFGKERLMRLTDLTHGTTWERVQLWKGCVAMAGARPVLGMGLNTYTRNFPEYRPEGYPDNVYAHNSYLQMASEIGYAGLAIFLVFLSALYIGGWRLMVSYPEGEMRNILIGFYAAGFGFMLYSITESALHTTILASLFWFIIGVVAAAVRRYGQVS